VRVHATVPLDGRVEFALELDVGRLSGPSAPVIDVGEHDLLHRASWLDLCSGVDPSVPTELLHREAARDERMRRALVELAYAAGRYAIIASTGELPATLQGVWQGSWTPAWSSDYTMNGNLQNGGAASLVPTGTPQLGRVP